MPDKVMTAEEIVKAKWPDAHCAPKKRGYYPDFYIIRATRTEWSDTLGTGHIPEAAWTDAARRLKGGESK